MFRPRRLTSLIVLLVLGPMVAAEDASRLLNLSLEELGSVKVDTVFAASKFSEKVTDAPSSVSIVTREQIRQFGYRTLADVVRSVRGFDITYDRNYAYAGVRGFNRFGDYGSKTLLLIDGHRMNDVVYDSTPVGTEGLLDVDLIERVEFIRGPGSALYGSNAFFGVISVTTRRGADLQGVELAGSYGSFDARSGRLTFGRKFASGLELMLSGSGFATDGDTGLFFPEYDSPETNRGVAYRRDGDRAWNFLGSVKYGDFTLRGGFATREKDIPTGAYGARFNDDGQSKAERLTPGCRRNAPGVGSARPSEEWLAAARMGPSGSLESAAPAARPRPLPPWPLRESKVTSLAKATALVPARALMAARSRSGVSPPAIDAGIHLRPAARAAARGREPSAQGHLHQRLQRRTHRLGI